MQMKVTLTIIAASRRSDFQRQMAVCRERGVEGREGVLWVFVAAASMGLGVLPGHRPQPALRLCLHRSALPAPSECLSQAVRPAWDPWARPHVKIGLALVRRGV